MKAGATGAEEGPVGGEARAASTEYPMAVTVAPVAVVVAAKERAKSEATGGNGAHPQRQEPHRLPKCTGAAERCAFA